MAYLSDTSIIVRLYDEQNPVSEIIDKCLNKLLSRGEDLVIVPQVLVEFWAVATRPKEANGLGMTSEEAARELETLQKLFKLLPENAQIFDKWKTLVVKYKISGKPTHDARIAAAMLTHNVENILTLNPNDFKRFTEINAVNPQDV